MSSNVLRQAVIFLDLAACGAQFTHYLNFGLLSMTAEF
jgi:hypothetical protein